MSAKNRKNRPTENNPISGSTPRRSLKDVYAAKKHSSAPHTGGAKAWIIPLAILAAGIGAFAAFRGDNRSTKKPDTTVTMASSGTPQRPSAPSLKPPAKPAAPSPPVPPTGPRVQFASTTYDFGRANGDDLVDCLFLYTNTGVATLELSAVTPMCGCMKVKDWTKKLEPGQSGRINVTYDSHHYTGPFAKSVSVTCNDPAYSGSMLEIKGFVFRPIEVSPLSAAITLTSEVPSNSVTVKIISHVEAPLTLSPPVSSNPALAVELRTNTPGKEFELTVTTPPPLPTGHTRSTITMNTSVTNMPVLSVEAFANVLALVNPIPNFIHLGPPPYTNAVPYNMWIRNNSTNLLVLSEPKVNAPGVDVQIKEELAGTQFGVTITFPAGFEVMPGETVELSVKCNHPTFPLLKVPVLQQPRVTAPAGVK